MMWRCEGPIFQRARDTLRNAATEATDRKGRSRCLKILADETRDHTLQGRNLGRRPHPREEPVSMHLRDPNTSQRCSETPPHPLGDHDTKMISRVYVTPSVWVTAKFMREACSRRLVELCSSALLESAW